MIRLDLNHLSTDWKKWVESVVKNTSGLKRPELKYGEVRIAGRLGNTWGGVELWHHVHFTCSYVIDEKANRHFNLSLGVVFGGGWR